MMKPIDKLAERSAKYADRVHFTVGAKPKTNADYVRSMTDDELAEWYWWMLHYVQGYTDSRVALREWLKEDYTTFVAQEYKKDLIDKLNREGIAP